MRKTVLALMTAGLTLVGCAVLSLGVPAVAAAQSGQASKAKPPKLNPKVLKPLQAALELANAGKYAEAEAALQPAEAVPDKTPYEQFQVDELAGFAAVKQQKFNAAAAAYERSLASGLLPADQVKDRLRLLAQLYLQTEPKDLAKSGEFGKRWLETTGTRDPAMLGLVGQSAYFGNNYGEAARYMQEAVTAARTAGNKPEENWLLILQSSYAKLQNAPGVTEATTDLVRYYPRPEHWTTLSRTMLTQAANKDRQILQVYRLMSQVGAMDKPDQFMEAANAAVQVGSPGEAVQFMEKGYATGILDSGGDKARSEALRAEVRRLAAADQKTLPQFEKEALAATAGEADVRLGEAFLSYDQPAKGVEAIRRGLGKGGVKSADEANLSLGRAYVLAHDNAAAIKAFELVKSPEYAQLAQLWSIYAGQQ